MFFQVLKFVLNETRGRRFSITATSFMSGFSRALLIMFVNAGATTLEGSRTPEIYGMTLDWPFYYFFIAFALSVLVYLLSDYYTLSRASMVVQELMQRLRMRIAAKMLRGPTRFVETSGDSNLYVRLTQDIFRLSDAAVTYLKIFQASVLLLFALGYLLILSFPGFLITVAAIVLGVSAYYLQRHHVRKGIQDARQRQVDFFGIIRDMIGGFKEIKASRTRHADIIDHAEYVADDLRDLNVTTRKRFIVSMLTTQLVTFLLVAGIVFFMPIVFPGNEVLVFQFLAVILFLVGPLEALVSMIPNVTRASVAFENLRDLEDQLDELELERDDIREATRPMNFESLELQDVVFNYRDEESQGDEEFDLGPINLKIEQGEVLFVIGGNGSGKTTLFKIITGHYEPVSGRILVNGEPVQKEDIQAYREIFSPLFAGYHIFERLYGLSDFDEDELDRLLDLMQLSGKTHYVKDEGKFSRTNLSSGQKKRLAYVVAHMDDRQVFMFDEFAANQDPEFRKFFYDVLIPELKQSGKTVIAVTHDDNYFYACDRLIKLDVGKLVEIQDYENIDRDRLLAAP